MAPIKFEEHIKAKFSERKIKPSAHAWDKIADELGTTSVAKKRGALGYAIAASVIGFVIASVFFFSYQDEIVVHKNQIVVDKGEKKFLKLEKATPTVIYDAVVIKERNWGETNAVTAKQLEKPKLKSIVVAQINASNDEEVVVVGNEKNIKEDEFEKTNFENSQAIINAKINELVAQVDALELNNTTVTDAEIDALLRKAQNEILEQKLFRNDNTVDAMALLTEAEEELDVSLRDQLFETLKNGYLKVRTAVADRNN